MKKSLIDFEAIISAILVPEKGFSFHGAGKGKMMN